MPRKDKSKLHKKTITNKTGHKQTVWVKTADEKLATTDLDKKKNTLLKKVEILIAKKKKLYANVDIETPMSPNEKKLNKDIADLFSRINKLVRQKRGM